MAITPHDVFLPPFFSPGGSLKKAGQQ